MSHSSKPSTGTRSRTEDDIPCTPLLIFKMGLLIVGVLSIPVIILLDATDRLHYIPEDFLLYYFLLVVFTVVIFPTDRKGQTY